jgi:hypothetical protein
VKKSAIDGTVDLANTIAAVAAFLEEPLARAITAETCAKQWSGTRSDKSHSASVAPRPVVRVPRHQSSRPERQEPDFFPVGTGDPCEAHVRKVLLEVISQAVNDDGVVFDAGTLTVAPIRDDPAAWVGSSEVQPGGIEPQSCLLFPKEPAATPRIAFVPVRWGCGDLSCLRCLTQLPIHESPIRPLSNARLATLRFSLPQR